MNPNENTTEDDQKPSATTASIWESSNSEELLLHPLLQVVFALVLEKFNLCMSKSYRDLDSKGSTDHKKIIAQPALSIWSRENGADNLRQNTSRSWNPLQQGLGQKQHQVNQGNVKKLL